jgi:NADH:ubiquinone reductase (H+-translocating)
MTEQDSHRVIVIGGGFGGLQAVRALRRHPVEITLVDRRNFHLFQPLLYQVATGALAPGEIATPLRAVFKRSDNVRVVLGEVAGFDLAERRIELDRLPNGGPPRTFPYDSLVVAGGSSYSYFGHDEWRTFAPDVKSLESALDVRRRLLTAFEAAELEEDEAARASWLTFVVVGAGPTGVELAGQVAEIARRGLRRDFREIDPASAQILLVEMSDRVLTGFPPRLSARAARSLERLGVRLLLERTVTDIDGHGIVVASSGGASERIEARTVVWAAGVVASGLAGALAAASGAELDRAGRIGVGPDLTLPGHPEVFAVGDMTYVPGADGTSLHLPGTAPVAMQQGRYAARVIAGRLDGRQVPPFHYQDKGNLATIGRAQAVADIKGLQLSGFVAWAAWLLVHLFYLIGFQNRVLVLVRWTVSFFTHGRGARLITGPTGEPEREGE